MTPRSPAASTAPARLAVLVVALAAALAPSGTGVLAQAADGGQWSDVFAYPGARLTQHGYYGHTAPFATVWAVEPDGRGGYYVGGHFDAVDGVELAGVAHWDGRAWRALGGGLRLVSGRTTATTPTVYDLMRARDGSLWATGEFDTAVQANGRAVRAAGVARWTGAAWEPVGGGLANTYAIDIASGRSLAEGPDGAVYVAGPFNTVVSALGVATPAYSVARWRGGAWEPLSGVEENASILAVAVRADGAVALGGGFPSGPRPGYANVAVVGADGAWAYLFDESQTTINAVSALAWDGDALFVGGAFSASYDNGDGTQTALGNVARWAGGVWDPMGGGAGEYVFDVTPDGVGGAYVAGEFASVGRSDETQGGGAVAAGGVARWTGGQWTVPGDVLPPSPWHFAPPFAATVAVSGGDLVVGGAFDGVREADGRVQAGAAIVLRRDGTWRAMSAYSGGAALGMRRSPDVWSVAVLASAPNPCGRGVLVAGTFETAGGEAAPGVALWDGREWQGFGGSLQAYGRAATVRVIAPAGCEGGQPRFFAAGAFESVAQPDGTEAEATGVVFWDGTRWAALGGAAPTGEVRAMAYDGETLFAVGTLRQGIGTGVYGWQPGRGWAPVGSGIGGDDTYDSGLVYALALGPDGALYVGGAFRAVRQPNGLSVNVGGLARWSGSAWEWIGNPTDGAVHALVFGPDGALYAGGTFSAFAQPFRPDTPARSVGVWDGTSWSDLGSPGVPVTALAVADDGRVFVGFDNTESGAYGEGDRLRVSGAGGWRGLGISAGGVATLTLDGGDLYVGGAFTEAGGTPSANVALYAGAQATSADAAPPAPALALSVAPNPARGAARLTVTLPEAGPVRVAVYDALGREVAVLADGPAPAGPLALALDAAGLPTGVYVARVQTAGGAASHTLTVVR